MAMARTAAKLVLIFCLVYAGVYFWYGRLESKLLAGIPESDGGQAVKTAADESDPGRGAGTVQPVSGRQNFQVIVSRNIFQAALDAKVKPEEKEEEEVIPTSLNLTLLGTVTGNNRDARAIIVDNNGRQQDLYQIGDALQGAFIESIERGKVTLSVNGKKEALLLKDREGGGPGPPKVSPAVSRPLPKAVTRKTVPRRVPQARPHRRISFRQDAEPAEADPEIIPLEEEATEEGLEADQPVAQEDDPGDSEPAVVE